MNGWILRQVEGGAAPLPAGLSEFAIQFDQDTFEEIYARNGGLVFSIALRIVKDAVTAEEIAQEVFVLFWRKSGKYDPARGALGPWLATLAHNRAVDQIRSKAERQRQVEEPSANVPDPFRHYNPEVAFDEMCRLNRVRAVLATMRSGERAAIELAYFEELTHTEIAARLDVPLGTAKSWIRAGLLHLREGLQPRPSPSLEEARSFAWNCAEPSSESPIRTRRPRCSPVCSSYRRAHASQS